MLKIVLCRDALIIGISRLSAVLPIIGIGQSVCWYRAIVVYTIGKYKFLFLLPKVNKHERLLFPVKVGAFCNFVFGHVFVLYALCSPSSK